MRQRNRLYTVNKYNRAMFLPERNMFLNGGAVVAADQLASKAYGANYGDKGFTLDDYMSSKNALGISKADNPFSKMNLKGGIGAMASTPIGGSLVSGLAGAAGGLANSAISGGLESGAGSAISSIGSTVGSAVGAVNPLLGAAVGVGSQLVGGLVNRAFGTKENTALKREVEAGINQNNNFVSNASSFDDIKGPQAVMTNTGVYSGGWFSGGKASRKNEELKRRMIAARDWANRSIDNNVFNLVDDQNNDALANYAAYGGPLSFGLGGVLFEDGGNTVHQTATRSDMDEEPEYTPGENAGTNYHEYWMSGRQQQMQENMNSGGYEGSAAEETEKQMNNISAHKERYSDPNNPDDAHMYDPIGFTTIMGQARSTRDKEGNLQAGDIVYNDVYREFGGVPSDVVVHERTHAMNLNPWNLSPQESKVDAILREKYGDDVHIAGKYYLRPAEVYAGLMQQRYQLKLSPDYQVTPEDIVKWRDNGMLNEYLRDKDDDMLLRLFNEVAYEPMNNQNNVNYAAYGGPMNLGINSGALGLMQQNRYFDTIDKRSEAIAGKGQTMQSGFTGGAKTFGNGGLAYTFLQDFGKDPIAAVVRYNQGLEDMAAKEALLRRSEEQSFQNDLLLQQMEDMRLTPPNFNINITQDYGIDDIPQAPKVDIVPMMPNTINKTNGELSLYSSTSKAASKDRIYETLPMMLKNAGLDVKVTSDYREAGKVGKAGDKSWHPRHGAVDIVPHGNTTFEDIENVVLTNPEIRSYMLANGYGYLDETNRTKEGKALMSKTGATGNHFHFGKDTSARNNYQRRVNLNAFGGELGTNGTDFTSGLLYIDEGNSHESNPLGGVPMGVDAEGIPNLVEEGETVYNDYVFSDRMTVPSFMLQDLGLPKNSKDISFADASKKLAMESEKRPNDPISKAGLQASLSRLAEIQETERMRKQAEEYMGIEGYACGGKMGRKYAGPGNQSNKLKPYSYSKSWDGFKYFDPKTGKYDEGYLNFVDNINQDWLDRIFSESQPYGSMDIYLAKNNGYVLTPQQAAALAQDKKYSDMHKAMAAAYDEFQAGINPKTGVVKSTTPSIVDTARSMGLDVDPQDTDLPEQGLLVMNPRTGKPVGENEDDYEGLGNPKTYATWMRYAPAVGSGIMALTDALGLTNKPDYTYADKIAGYAERAGVAPQVSYKPIGNYLRYNPMDIWYQQNALNAQARATDRALMNSSSLSKAAGLLANGYNSQLASGNLYRQALEYNDAKRKEVADFNRKTNMFNSQMGLEAAMANARYQQAASQMGLSGLAQAAALRDQIDARTGAAKSANLTNFLTSLGNIGRENFAMNQLNTDRSRNYYGDLTGDVSGYKRKKKSCGGKMNRK